MAKIPIIDPIRFLLERKYPNYEKLRLPGLHGLSSESLNKRMEAIDDYETKLKSMSPEEVDDLYKKEKEKYKQELDEKAEAEEQGRFFNFPSADANFDHWSKATYWTLEESIALSFGKNPERVNWDKIKNYVNTHPPSPFVEKYRLRRDLAIRAKKFNLLYDPILPNLFLAWAKRTDIDVPTELVKKIESRGLVLADWQDMYKELKEKYDSLSREHVSLLEQTDKITEQPTPNSEVSSSSHWQKFEQLANKAITEYPAWSKSQRKIQKTGNLQEWLTSTIGADNREAELIKKFLSDFYDQLK